MSSTVTITIATAANSDTTQWEPGWGNWYANDLLFGVSGYSGAQYASTIRLPNVTIPQGSTITSAVIYFVAEQSWNAPYPIKVYFNAADNAVAPTSYSDAQTKLSALTNYVAWTPGNWTAESSYASANLSSALQEITDRAGFTSSNAIMAVIYGTIGVPAYTYNLQNPYAHSTSKRPYIVITYIDYTIGPLYRVDAMTALIRTQLKESSDTILTDAIILQAINDGQKEVASRAFCIEHEDTVTTVAGDRLVPFSGHRVNKVLYQSGRYWDDTFDSLDKWFNVSALAVTGGHVSNISVGNPSYSTGLATLKGTIDDDVYSVEMDLYYPRDDANDNGGDRITFQLDVGLYSIGVSLYRLYTGGAARFCDGNNVRYDLTYPAESFVNCKVKIAGSGETHTAYFSSGSTGWIATDTITGNPEYAVRGMYPQIVFAAHLPNGIYFDNLVFNNGAPVSPTEEINKGALRTFPTAFGFVSTENTFPQYWFQWGNYIVIEPVPDAAYSLTLFVSDYPAAALTLDTEYPSSLPDEFHPCIVDFACYVLSLKLHNWKQAGEYYNRYIVNLKKRKQEYMERKAEKRSIHTQLNVGG